VRPALPFLILGLAACAVPSGPARQAGRPPNVVVVLVDDLGWTDLGVQGSSFYETPNVDRLAAEGLRLTSASAACAVCSPTRAALLTGRYPARVGLTDWIRSRFQGGATPADGNNPSGWAPAGERALSCPRNPLWLEREEVTLAEALGAAGWRSAHVGKWHLGFEGHDPTDHFPHYHSKEIGPYSIVRSGRWKLIRWWEGGRSELYDLEADPSETTDLAAERAELARELGARLDAHLAAVGARLPRPPEPEGTR
jgi:arylsulfatase A-like enzyme